MVKPTEYSIWSSVMVLNWFADVDEFRINLDFE